jgi:hypothetical protein
MMTAAEWNAVYPYDTAVITYLGIRPEDERPG